MIDQEQPTEPVPTGEPTAAAERAAEALCRADDTMYHLDHTNNFPCTFCRERAQALAAAGLLAQPGASGEPATDAQYWLERGQAEGRAKAVAAVEALAVRWESEAEHHAQWRGRGYAERLRAAIADPGAALADVIREAKAEGWVEGYELRVAAMASDEVQAALAEVERRLREEQPQAAEAATACPCGGYVNKDGTCANLACPAAQSVAPDPQRCGWCHLDWSQRPAFDCKNSRHTGTAQPTAPDMDGLRERLVNRLLDSRGWSVNDPTRSQALACEQDADAALAAFRPHLDAITAERDKWRDAWTQADEDRVQLVESESGAHDRAEKVEAQVAALREQIDRVKGVHAKYFDLDGRPGYDDTTPEPEDVWRYDRDFREALDGGDR